MHHSTGVHNEITLPLPHAKHGSALCYERLLVFTTWRHEMFVLLDSIPAHTTRSCLVIISTEGGVSSPQAKHHERARQPTMPEQTMTLNGQALGILKSQYLCEWVCLYLVCRVFQAVQPLGRYRLMGEQANLHHTACCWNCIRDHKHNGLYLLDSHMQHSTARHITH